MTAARWIIRVLVAIIAVSIAVAAVAATAMLAFDVRGNGRVIGTCLVIAVHAALALGSVALIRRDRLVSLCWIALAASGGAMVTWSLLIAADFSWMIEQDLLRWGITCTALGVLTVYTGGFLALSTRSGGLHAARWIVIVLAWVFVVSAVATLWLTQPLSRLLPERALIALAYSIGITGAVAMTGSLLVRMLIMMMALRERSSRESLDDRVQLELSCPRCGSEMCVPAGPARCPSCRLTMMIEVEEPRCACGYLLYDLVGEQCPECGRKVVPWVGQPG